MIVPVYASWFWVAGADSEHFKQSSECGTVLSFFAPIPAKAFRGVSIFFAVLSILFAASWSFGLFPYCEDFLAFFKSKAIPLSPAAKKELLEYINTHCNNPLVILLAHDSKYRSSRPLSASLQGITYTYLIIRSGARETRSIVRLDRPLEDMQNRQKVQKRIENTAKLLSLIEADNGQEEEGITMSDMRDFIFAISKDPSNKLSRAGKKTFNMANTVFVTGSIACAIYTILAMWNGIDGVYTIQATGQLIPFIIGVIGLFKALHDVHFEFELSFPAR